MVAAPVPAAADATVSGTVTSAADGTAISGAFVAVVGPGGRFATVTDESGEYSMTVTTGNDYTAKAHATGFAVQLADDIDVADGPVTQDLGLTPSGAKFQGLGVYGGQIGTILADATSGIFYATTSVIPQLYRTADYGGSWTPVTLEADDQTYGLDGSTNLFRGYSATTSGYPGEAVIIIGNAAHYSTDFGVTWKIIAGTLPSGSGGTALYWGHAGSTSVLLAVAMDDGSGASTHARADMNAATPTWTEMTTPYVTAGGALAVANASDGAYVVAVNGSGGLNVYDLAENPPATALATLSGLPAPPAVVRLGGAKSTGVPPDALLVYSSTTGTALMATKSGGTTFTSVSAATAVSDDCGASVGAIGSVAPQSTGTTGAGTVAGCFVRKSGTGSLVITRVDGINNNTGLAFDAGYDGASNQVILSGDGGRGLVKSASSDGDGVPVFPPSTQDAAAGTASGSGGVAVTGFDVPVVKDTAFGPDGAAQVATMLSFSGGALGVASEDGGATFTIAVHRGGGAVDWWQGSSSSWLVFGHGGDGELLTAITDWDSTKAPLSMPNITGATAATVGTGSGGGVFSVMAITGVAGSDTFFIGGGDNQQAGSAGSLYRATLTSGTPPTIGNITELAASEISSPVRALAYCPATGSDSSVQDVLFAATGTEAGATPAGALLRIADATGASPSASGVASIPTSGPVNDVRLHCGSATVYVGVGSNNMGPSGALYKSTDGGASFSAVTVSASGVPSNLNAQVVAVNPADPDEVLFAGNSEGYILLSEDGGSTWTVVNDPTAEDGRNFMSEGVGDLEIPPSGSSLTRPAGTARRSAVDSSEVLVGTGSGLFAADIRSGAAGGDPCSSLSGLDAVECELDGLEDPDLCGTDPIHPKLQSLLTKKVTKARRFVQKAGKTTKAKRIAKLTRLAGKTLRPIKKKADKLVRKNKLTIDCRTTMEQRIDSIEQLLSSARQ